MRTPQWFTHSLLMVALLATIPTTPVFGQPPPAPPEMVEVESDDPETDGRSEGQVLNDDTSSPAIPPPPQTAQQPEPVPAPTPADQTVHEYGDKEAEAWKDYHYPAPATQVVKQYIQNGLNPDEVFKKYEDRFIKPIRFRREGGKLIPSEPPARNNKDRRLSRKLVYDLAIGRRFVHWVVIGKQKDGLPIYQARFRSEKKDEIISWIVTESSADLVTTLQITMRNFIEDDFQPLKQQVAKNTKAIANHEQRLKQAEANILALQESSGVPPVLLEPEPVATETPTPEASETPAPEASQTPAPVAEESPTPTETPLPTDTPSPSATPPAPEETLDSPTSALISPTGPKKGPGLDYWPWLGGFAVLALGTILVGAKYYRKGLTEGPAAAAAPGTAPTGATEVVDGEIIDDTPPTGGI